MTGLQDGGQADGEADPAASADPGSDGLRLSEIAGLLIPCPPPNVLAGEDLCPCGRGGSWPCAVTRAAWLARRLDPGAESTRVLTEIMRGTDPGAAGDPW